MNLELIMQGSVLLLVLLGLALLFTYDKLNQARGTTETLKRQLNEMDEQAKLIVRTDMELNRTQDELDKKVTGLFALQRLSRTIGSTFEEKLIFQMIKPSYLSDLGFEKAVGFLWDEKNKQFVLHLCLGYADHEAQGMFNAISADGRMYLDFIKKEKTLSSFSLSDPTFKDRIQAVFLTETFVISPITPHEGSQGILFLGTNNPDMMVSEGDEELITILASQVSQALENARLFEKTWRAQHDLEKKVEERTQALSTALEEVNVVSRRKSTFISAVSHELRTPLTSIKGYAAILLTEKLGALPSAVKERLAKINLHSDELVHMVNDLLDIARIESGKTIMKLEPQKLQDLVANVADLIAVQCKEKNISLQTEVTADTPAILADRTQIERVFINLLGNAVKFTPVNGTISINTTHANGMVCIKITDTGIGIPPEALTNIFDEFYRVDNEVNQQVKGTGLGLSLVRQIVEAHKGRIWVESIVGKGSSFLFTLPEA